MNFFDSVKNYHEDERLSLKLIDSLNLVKMNSIVSETHSKLSGMQHLTLNRNASLVSTGGVPKFQFYRNKNLIAGV